MSSTNSPTMSLPKLSDPDTASAMFEAVRSVAEQSFFAVAEPGDERSFAAQAAAVPSWLIATVRFEQGTLQGSVACTMPSASRRTVRIARPAHVSPLRPAGLASRGESGERKAACAASQSGATQKKRLMPCVRAPR